MDVQTALREVDEATGKHVGSGADDERRDTYRMAFEEVEELGGGAAVEELLGHVASHVRDEEERPGPAAIDRYARAALESTDTDVPDDVSFVDRKSVV